MIPFSALNAIRWVAVLNDSGEEIPPFSVVRISGADTSGVVKVAKPDTDNQTNVMVTGPAKIPIAKHGVATAEWPNYAAYDVNDGTPVNGEAWGVKAAEFKLRKGNTGFVVVGGPIESRVMVFPSGGGGGGSQFPFPARLTGSSGSAYNWTEQEKLAGGTFQDLAGGRSGILNAYELNGTPGLDITAGNPVVWLFPGVDQEWLFCFSTLQVTDLGSGQQWNYVQGIIFDSTPSAYDPASGDYVMTFDDATRVVTSRLNGLTGTLQRVKSVVCNGSTLTVVIEFETVANGLVKTNVE